MTTLTPRPELRPEDFTTSPARQRREAVVRLVLLTAAATSLVISGLIVFSLVREAWSFIAEIAGDGTWSTLWSDVGWFPRRGEFDVRTLLVGSVLVGGIAMLVAGPIGLASAIYLSEYASPRVRRVLKPLLETLAGIPSVVLGFFAFQFIAPEVIQRFWDGSPQANLLSAGLGVGILTVPLVASVSEDAMRSVPMALREASYGLGARKVTTSVRVVIPAAVSGLVAAMIIAVSRAIGETMVVAIASGGAGGSALVLDPLEPGTTMTAAMIGQARGTDQVAGQGPTFQSLFFVGFVLFLLTFSLNMAADRFVRRVRQAY
jgi:phosphate transport system permease protein